MKEYILSNMEETLKSTLVQFMVFNEMPCADCRYMFKGEIWEFFTGIPYGFMGRIRIYEKKDGDKYRELLQDRYMKFVTDEGALTGLFLKRIKVKLEKDEKINMLRALVPEAYPPELIN